MQCPKCGNPELKDLELTEGLMSHHCDQCGGDWLDWERYQQWQYTQEKPSVLNVALELKTKDFTPSETDGKAALSPDARRYMSRVKIPTSPPFYIERCPESLGFWCDRQEWAMLKELGLHVSLEHLFTSEWQHKVRDRQHAVSERQALIQKLGQDLADEVFKLGEKLAEAENGDFAVAYLARQVTDIPE